MILRMLSFFDALKQIISKRKGEASMVVIIVIMLVVLAVGLGFLLFFKDKIVQYMSRRGYL